MPIVLHLKELTRIVVVLASNSRWCHSGIVVALCANRWSIVADCSQLILLLMLCKAKLHEITHHNNSLCLNV